MPIFKTLILRILRSKRSDAFKMAVLTKAFNRITELDLRSANLEDSEIILLAKALEQNNTLISLDLSSNKTGVNGKVGLEAVKALAKILETNKTLKSLNLSYNDIGPEATKILAKALEKNQSLTNLNLDSNKIDTAGIQALSEALKINRALKHLNLGGSDESANIESLATILGANQSSITSLSLGYRIMGDNAVQALATALETNRTLTNLDLRHIRLGTSGAQALARALMFNQTLRSLNLDSTDIDSVGAIALVEALKINTTLSNLSFQENHISTEGFTAFANLLTTNRTLRKLNFCRSWGYSIAADLFAKALETNNTLRDLDLSNTGVTPEGAKKFEKVLKTNKSLIELDLYDFDLYGKYFRFSGRPPAKDTKINAYLERNRVLLAKRVKRVDEALESSPLIPPLIKIVKDYADLPDTQETNKKTNKITAFIKNLVAQFQLFLRRIVKFFQRQWTNIKNLINKSTPSDTNKTSDLKQNQGQPSQTTPLVPERETMMAPKDPQSTTTTPTQTGEQSRKQPRTKAEIVAPSIRIIRILDETGAPSIKIIRASEAEETGTAISSPILPKWKQQKEVENENAIKLDKASVKSYVENLQKNVQILTELRKNNHEILVKSNFSRWVEIEEERLEAANKAIEEAIKKNYIVAEGWAGPYEAKHLVEMNKRICEDITNAQKKIAFYKKRENCKQELIKHGFTEEAAESVMIPMLNAYHILAKKQPEIYLLFKDISIILTETEVDNLRSTVERIEGLLKADPHNESMKNISLELNALDNELKRIENAATSNTTKLR